jgi:hypothetical protein
VCIARREREGLVRGCISAAQGWCLSCSSCWRRVDVAAARPGQDSCQKACAHASLSFSPKAIKQKGAVLQCCSTKKGGVGAGLVCVLTRW